MRHQLFRTLLGLSLLLLTLGVGTARADTADAAVWEKLKTGNYVVLMRHAETDPGIGDPAGFKVADCSTQRNLSATGRAHAQRIGAAFAAQGIPIGRVLSSHWCRCIDTAQLTFGKVTPDRMVDSMFNDRSKSDAEKLAEVKLAVQQPAVGGNLVLVTHAFNVNAIAGVSIAPGEVVVMARGPAGTMSIAGRLRLQ